MITLSDLQIGHHVFYQKPHMPHPEYGIITSFNDIYVFIKFFGDSHSKACDVRDLYWPPDFCMIDRCNPIGQKYGHYPAL